MSRIDTIKEEIEKNEKGYGPPRAWYVNREVIDELGIKEYRAKQDHNFIRIIPPEDEKQYFGFRIYVHYNIGPNNDAFLCPRMMLSYYGTDFFGDNHQISSVCPICERIDEMRKEGVDNDTIRSISCFPPRFLFFIVDVESEETEEEGVQLYDAASSINSEILDLCEDPRTGGTMDISDIDKGKTIVFKRKGKKAHDTRYSAFKTEDADPLPDKWLDIPDFRNVIVFGSVDEMKKSLYIVESVNEEEDQSVDESKKASSETEPSSRTRRERRKRQTEDTEEETTKEPAEETSPHKRRRESSKQEPIKDENKEENREKIRERVRERLGRKDKGK